MSKAVVKNTKRSALREQDVARLESACGMEVLCVKLSFGTELCIMRNDNSTIQAFLLGLNEGDVEELGEGPMLTPYQLTKCLGVAAVTSAQRKARRALNAKIQAARRRLLG